MNDDTLEAASPDAGEAVTEDTISDEQVWDELEAEENGTASAPEGADPVVEAAEEEAEGEVDPAPVEEDAGNAEADEPVVAEETEAASKDAVEDDIWANVPEAARKAYEEAQAKAVKLEHAAKSNSGRITAYQKQLRALTEKPADTAADEARVQAVEKLQEEYPDIAQPLLDQIGRQDGTLSALRAEMESIRAERYNENQERVIEAHPDLMDVVAKNSEIFAGWVEDQPLATRQAVAANQEHFVNPKAAIEVTAKFKEHLSTLGLYELPKAEAPAAVDGKTEEKRARQLAGAAAPRTRAAPPRRAGIPENGSWADTWEAFDAEEARAK